MTIAHQFLTPAEVRADDLQAFIDARTFGRTSA
jgi:hypothetical protein